MARSFGTTPFMYTVCPKCALTLVVTAADLRVAQGFVRCGRCSNVFNALARLSEERGTAAAGTASATLSQPAPPLPPAPAPEPSAADPEPVAEEDSIPDSALEFDPEATDVSKVFVEQRPDPQWSAATGKFKALFRKNQARTPTSTPQGTEPPRPPAALTGTGQSGTANRAAPTQSPQIGAARAAPTQAGQPGPARATPTQSAQPGAARATPTQSPQPGTARAAPTQPTPRQQQPTHVPPANPAAALSPSTPSDAAPQKIPTDEDLQFDIEVDAEFLAATTQLRPQSPAPAAGATSRVGGTQSGAAPDDEASPGIPASGTPSPVTADSPGSETPALVTAGTPAGETATPSSVGTAVPSAAAPPGTIRASPTPEGGVGSATLHRAPPRQPPRSPPLAPPQDVGIPVADELGDAQAAARARPSLTHGWGAGSAVLVLLLAVQIVNHYRHDLATHQSLYKPLTRLYAALGVPLVPRWNLGAYDVRQLGASADNSNSGQITVRASVKNTGKQPQPLPLLRVTLQDRFGNRIAGRDVPPKSYLPSAIPPASFLSAGQRIDAEMAFVDPGANAVGFEIDACLPEPGGSVACANDASTH